VNHKIRSEYIRVLLSSRLDYLPTPKGMRVFQSALPGPAPGRYHPCENCKGMGRLKNSTGRLFRCLVCGGSGWRKRKRGEQVYDGYTRQKVAAESQDKVSSMSSKRIDQEISTLQINQLLREGSDAGEDFFDSGRRLRDSQGSYKELENALAWLADHHPNLSRLLMLIYDQNLLSRNHLNPVQRFMEAYAVALLSRKMKGKVYLPRWEYRKIRDEKRSRIKILLRKRIPPIQIARELGVSKRYIDRVKESLSR
jgi:hypothetical protein